MTNSNKSARPWQCRIGWHDWDYFHMAVTFIQAFGYRDPCVSRRCLRCGTLRMWTNEKEWVFRL